MDEFDWTESRGSENFSDLEAGLSSLGNLPAPDPRTISEPAFVPTSFTSPVAADAKEPVAGTPSAPLTRRELRERERAAELANQTELKVESSDPVASLFSAEAGVQKPVDATSVDQGAWGSSVVNLQAEPITPPWIMPTQPAVGSTKENKVPKSRRSKAGKKLANLTNTARYSTRPGSRRSAGRKIVSKLMSLGAMVGVGLMMISTSIPANAFFKVEPVTGVQAESVVAKADAQQVKVAADAGALSVVRDSYTATSWKEQLFLRYGSRNYAYTPNPNATIRWPFPIAVPISDGFGWRVSPCKGCSTWHKGTDFTPGRGAIIGNVAEGVVSMVDASHFGLGNHVIVDSHINGHLIQVVYAHMEDDSFRVKVGDHVMPGDEIGLVGSTGQSTGAHLHLEIHVDGVPVDPFEWLKENSK